jgi:hypothetical protein
VGQANSRHNLIIKQHTSDQILVRQVSIKTRPANWKNNLDPVIIPLSIHSLIYKDLDGKFKMAALLSAIRSNVHRKVTVLLCEGAHLNTLSLKYNGDMIKAALACNRDSQELANRLHQEFCGHEVLSWNELIFSNLNYKVFKEKVYDLYQLDTEFQCKVLADAEASYDIDRSSEYPCKDLYIRNAKTDLLEQCIYLLIVTEMGYKFEIYPGKRNSCVEYINNKFLTLENRLTRVNVTLGSPKEVLS